MEDSEVGRLPPELWDKVIFYLIHNNGFYENLELLGILYKIPDAVGILNDAFTYISFDTCWRTTAFEFTSSHAHLNYRRTFGPTTTYRIYENNMELEISVPRRYSFLIIRECESGYSWRTPNEICKDLAKLYGKIGSLPHGIRIQMASMENPLEARLIQPSWEHMKMRTRPVHKFKSGTHYMAFFVVELSESCFRDVNELPLLPLDRELSRCTSDLRNLVVAYGMDIGRRLYAFMH
jgi:hypothetical protein